MATTSAPIPGTSSASLPTAPSALPVHTNFPNLMKGPVTDLKGRGGNVEFVWQNLPAVINLPFRVQGRLRDARDAALEKIQAEMVEYAQDNAPWRDVTGDARAELHSPNMVKTPTGDRIVVLAHGVSYGVYLETRDGGALGIIAQTIEKYTAELPARIAAELSNR